MLERWYRVLWMRIGGRPWTYIIRDAWLTYEFFWIVGLVSLGIWLGHLYQWLTILKGWLIFSAGYIAGHLFWGTKYIADQKNNSIES